MTQLESARIKEVIGVKIGTVQECAHKLRATGDVEELEADIGTLEKAVDELKGLLEALPHRHLG